MSLIPVIIGPTAGGKTELALAVAARFAALGMPAEIISADSVQIYRGLDIGSAKPTAAERAAVPHHLIDVAEPDQPFTVRDWLRAADAAIDDIRRRGARPVVAGGTHLYVKALIEGLFDGPGPDPALRRALAARSLDQLRAELERVDPEAAARIHANDARRTIRALEVFHTTGKPISRLQTQWDQGRPRRDDLRLFALAWPTEAINRRINRRVRAMMAEGLADEVRRLEPRMGQQARAALGYRQLLEALAGATTLDRAAEMVAVETRRLAKNQRTWLKRLAAGPGFRWIPMPADDIEAVARAMVDSCAGPG